MLVADFIQTTKTRKSVIGRIQLSQWSNIYDIYFLYINVQATYVQFFADRVHTVTLLFVDLSLTISLSTEPSK